MQYPPPMLTNATKTIPLYWNALEYDLLKCVHSDEEVRCIFVIMDFAGHSHPDRG